MNGWSYVEGNPINWVDPSGWCIPEYNCPGDPAFNECETCNIHEVIPWIIAKMRQNAVSKELMQIRDLLATPPHFYKDAFERFQKMPWWQKLLTTQDYFSDALAADGALHDAPYIAFGCLVSDANARPLCGQWDYKKEIERLFDNSQHIDFCAIGYDEMVIFYYDIFANIHFGYVGEAAGFSETALLEGADIEQPFSNIMAAIKYPSWENISNVWKGKDPISDKASIKIGIDLYRTSLNTQTLLEQLYLHKHELHKARLNEKGEFEVYQ
jgi:hypothetical protein